MQQIQDLAASAGGYTSQAQLYQYSGDLMRGMVVIRVPAESYDSILDWIRSLGSRVLSENSSASDVTAEYTDLEAQLRNLEAAERELTSAADRGAPAAQRQAVRHSGGVQRPEPEARRDRAGQGAFGVPAKPGGLLHHQR